MSGAQIDPAEFIRANLTIVPVPGLPEIRLYRAHPASRLRHLSLPDRDETPYWAYAWPGGQAIARHVLDHPEIVAGRRVFDLGAGGGLVGIAAVKAGAREVVAAEINPIAAVAIRLNAAENDVALTIVSDDPLAGPTPAADLVLVGDLFYALDLARRVTAFLDRCISSGLDVLVGDIGRAFLPRSRLRSLADYPALEVGEAAETTRSCTVFSFQAETGASPTAQSARP